MRQLYAYVANESTCHRKPFVDPLSIPVVFFIDERPAKGTYAAFILRLYPRFWILFLFMHLELLRSRMWVNINRPATSRPHKFHKKSREASGANYREQSGRGRKSRNTVFVSQTSGVAVWRWKSCLLLLRFLLPLLLFFLYMTSARAQNRHSKFQFHSESVSNLLGHAYQFLDMSVKPSLDYVRLFDFCIFSFFWLKNCLESQR